MNDYKPFFSRKYCCPVCKTNFNSIAVRSSAVYVERKEPDLHVIYRGISPLHYSIIVCPDCYYAASHNRFSDKLDPELSERLLIALNQLRPDKIIDYNQERDINTALESFKLAIRSAQLKQVPAGELAGLFMGAAWLSREINDSELETTYLKEALSHYIYAYNKDFKSIGNMSDVQAAYLIGELYRRNGNYNEAVNWFNKVIVHNDIRKYPHIEKMARDQWALARDQSKLEPVSEEALTIEQNESQEETTVSSTPVNTGSKTVTPQHRLSMQLSANLYSDQIDWLTRIVNNGYNSSKSLVSKEQVLRALLDAVIENLDTNLPEQFSCEKELKTLFSELLAANH